MLNASVRHVGDVEQSVHAFHPRAYELYLRGRYAELLATRRLIEMSPDDHEVKVIRGNAYLGWKGTPDTLSAMLRQIPPVWDHRGMATY